MHCATLLLTSAVIANDRPAAVVEGEPALHRVAAQMEHWHDSMAGALSGAIERLDRLFGDQRIEEEGEGTRLAVSLGVRADDRDGAKLENRIRLRLALPNLERRLLLIIEGDESESADQIPQALADTVREARPLAGIRLALAPLGRARFSVDGGVRLGGDPQIVTRGRLSLVKARETWEQRLRQTVAWYSADGWSATTEARWTWRMGEELLFRTTSALGWKATENGVTPSQALDLFRAVGTARGHRWTARAEWPETPKCRRALYVIEYTFRTRLYRDWLYGEATGGMDFGQDRGYDPNPFAVLRLEIVLGN